jgi:hypothetical protein
MLGQIIKSRFYCKSGQQTSPAIKNAIWRDQFIEGKWYDGEYQTWGWEDGFKLNGGCYKYWVIEENGTKIEMQRSRMKSVFQLDKEEVRNIKIEQILKK